MYFRPRTSLIVISIACCASGIAVGDDAIRARPKQIEQWVQQLGDEAFEVREQASLQLSTLGLSAKKELLAGIRGTDPEIRWRCAKLWAAVSDTDFQLRAEAFLNDPEGNDNHEFPGWDRYRKVFGTSREVRQTFLGLQRAEPILWEAFGNVSANNPLRFRLRCQQLQKVLKDRQGRSKIEGAAALTVLFMSAHYEPIMVADDSKWMNELWNLAAVVDLVRSDATWTSFKSAWFRRQDDPRPAFERLMAGLSTGSDETIPIARELLQNQNTPANQKQFSLLVLAKSRMPEDDLLIQGFLEDSSEIDIYFSRGIVLKSQLRDVALAALIVRAGKDPVEFGFKYLRRDERTLFSPSSLGFNDDDDRRAAFEKWLSRANWRDDDGIP